MSEEDVMSDEEQSPAVEPNVETPPATPEDASGAPTTEPATDTPPAVTTDDAGSTEPVVPTDTPPPDGAVTETPEETIARLTDALTEKDALLAERDEHIADLEADPYRTPTRKGQLQYRSPRVAAFEENAWQGEVEGWERTTGKKYDDVPPAGIEV